MLFAQDKVIDRTQAHVAHSLCAFSHRAPSAMLTARPHSSALGRDILFHSFSTRTETGPTMGLSLLYCLASHFYYSCGGDKGKSFARLVSIGIAITSETAQPTLSSCVHGDRVPQCKERERAKDRYSD